MASTLHVVLYHPSVLPVAGYGGTERVVVWLARGLAQLGHRVTLIALPGTRVPETTLIEVDRSEAFRPGGARLDGIIPAGADVVHAHVPLARPPRSVPFVWTFHGTGKPGRVFPDSTIALSADHAARHGIERWVHNGLDPDDYRFSPSQGGDDLFLGRLHSVKGWQWAVRGARRAGRRITVAGGWRPTLRPGVRYAGTRKLKLLAEAACLWMPAQWDEPFGLTTIEAMVSGTPVLGTRRGALPEIITPESGAMGDSLEELVDLRPTLDRLDRGAVRDNVLRRFTHIRMAERYVELYREERSETGDQRVHPPISGL
ncbi:MAG TPA: glycosyltransferase [Gemmatimonadales bacterium]|nr:glycosyltransferase [Gemmatimonadales bacterium]